MHRTTGSLTTNSKRHINKLVLGFVGIAATTVIGTAGIAAARPDRDPNAPNPPSKAACANFAQYGFKNRGQCVSWWELHNNPGHGYGGGSSVSTTNNVTTNMSATQNGGSHNVISVVFHYVFG